jgi:hypothetical protein
MANAKEIRRAEAHFTLALKRARQTSALSVAFLRTISVRAVLFEELEVLRRSSADVGVGLDEAVAGLEVTPASRVSALIVLFYASLNVVVEGWRDPNQAAPKLADDSIDVLLSSAFAKTLTDFRNAMLHPNPLLDKRFLKFGEDHSALLPWTLELCDHLHRYFREWQRQMSPDVRESM